MGKKSGTSGGHEHSAGGARVRSGAQDDPEDAGVFAAAWLSAEEAGGALDSTPQSGQLAAFE